MKDVMEGHYFLRERLESSDLSFLGLNAAILLSSDLNICMSCTYIGCLRYSI